MTLILPQRGGRKERVRVEYVESSFQEPMTVDTTQTAPRMNLGTATLGKTVLAFIWATYMGSYSNQNVITGVTIGGVAATLSGVRSGRDRNTTSGFAALNTTATSGDVVVTTALSVETMAVHIFEVYNLKSISAVLTTATFGPNLNTYVSNIDLPIGESLIIGGINGKENTAGDGVSINGLPASIANVVNRPSAGGIVSEVYAGLFRRDRGGAIGWYSAGAADASHTAMGHFGAFQ